MPRRAFLAAGAGLLLAACGSSGDGGDDAAGTVAPDDTAAAPSSPSTRSGTPPVARFVDHGPDARRRVALTFHTNGDLGLADQMLDLLAERDTAMTAFLVGDWLDANPSWGRRLVDAGHEVANHTWSHPSFLSLDPDSMYVEIMRCRDVLQRTTGTPGTLFRPSGTDDGTTAPPDSVLGVAAEAGYATVLGFDVDPFDYEDPGVDAVVQRTLAAVRPGAIVSLHLGHPGTVAAMPSILDGLSERDLTAVTASKLLA